MAQESKTISTYLQDEIGHGAFPGAQYVIGQNGKIIREDAIGQAAIEPELIPATVDTIYDLASLTKPLVTSLLMVMLAERGLVDLNASVSDYLSEFDGEAAINDDRPITLMRLLTHTSGLPNWRPLYLEAESPADVPAAIARTSIESRNRQLPPQVIYSDLNYILLGLVIERVRGARLDFIARREIFDPLGLKQTMFNPPPELKSKIAATERGQQFEQANADAETKREAGEQGSRGAGVSYTASLSSSDERTDQAMSPFLPYSPAPLLPCSPASRHYQWREDVIWGEVHDGNAHFLGGVAGHAGLFSTAREVFRIANQFLPGSILVKPESIHLFTDNLTPGFDTARSIGWVLASTRDCSAGAALPLTVIGHNGFTGTSVWIDPDRRRVFILLTNRVHPKVSAVDMKCVRQRFNMLAFEDTVSGF